MIKLVVGLLDNLSGFMSASLFGVGALFFDMFEYLRSQIGGGEVG